MSVVCRVTAQSPTPANIIEAIQKGNYDDALHWCDGLLRADPKSPKLWTLRGLALERSDHPHEALKAYLEALETYSPELSTCARRCRATGIQSAVRESDSASSNAS